LPLGLITPSGRRHEQDPWVAGHREDDPGQQHEARTRDEDPTPPQAIGVGRQPQADRGVAEQRQGQDHPDHHPADAERHEVQDQHDREKAVAEHAGDAGREEEARVGAHRSPRLDH